MDEPIVITQRDIYDALQDISKKVDAMGDISGDFKIAVERIRKLEVQIASQWVIVGITIAVITAFITKGI